MVGPMMKHALFQRLLRAFSLNTAWDYVLKPLAVLGIFIALFGAVAVLILQVPIKSLPASFLTGALVQLPFNTLAFAMVTYMDRMQTHLAEPAMTDVLTGLQNRRSLVAKAGGVRSSGQSGFVLIIDANHFKRINDTYGHAVGDSCLQAIAKRLNDVRRPENPIGRIGGKEFGAFMLYCSMQEIDLIGRKLCNAIRINLLDERVPQRLTLSVGVATTQVGDTLEHAMRRADELMYKAKLSGRGAMVS
jgi:diguanylate cyclase